MALQTEGPDLVQMQHDDPNLLDIIRYVEDGTLPGDKQRASHIQKDAHSYFLDGNGILKRIAQGTHKVGFTEQIVVPKVLKTELLIWSHESPTAGHFGRDRTYLKLAARYYWDTMRKDVESWVRCCVSCQSRKTPPGIKRAPLQPNVSTGPWERLIMDIKGPLVTTHQGNKYIQVIMDHYMKFAICTGMRSQTSREIAEILFYLPEWSLPYLTVRPGS
jgi:hypothetical protein